MPILFDLQTLLIHPRVPPDSLFTLPPTILAAGEADIDGTSG